MTVVFIIIFVFIVLIIIGNSQQNKEQKEKYVKETIELDQKLSKIKNDYSIDNNDNITYVHIIENIDLTINEIFNHSVNYFIYKYGSGKDVIQTKEQKKDSAIVIGTGYYRLGDDHFNQTTDIELRHIIRVEIKENRARITISLTDLNYKKKVVTNTKDNIWHYSDKTIKYVELPKFGNWNKQIFLKGDSHTKNSILEIQEKILNGNVIASNADSNW